MLKQRIITAIILTLAIVGTIFFLDRLFVSILFSLILLVSIIELANMTISTNKLLKWLLAVAIVALFFIFQPGMGIRSLFYYSYTGLIMWLLILLFMLSYRFSGQWSQSLRLFSFVFSAILIWICVNGLVFIHQHFEQGSWILMYVLTLVWVADIGAYFSGKSFGKNKLAPGISPGKTVEGVFGGMALNVLWISVVYTLSGGWGLHYFAFLILGLITSAMSVVGDLYESILKREAGIKDSGHILPGHGGILDRIDSVIAATPVYLAGLYMLSAV
jgi:phosphatidate cytidylyltransferase